MFSGLSMARLDSAARLDATKAGSAAKRARGFMVYICSGELPGGVLDGLQLFDLSGKFCSEIGGFQWIGFEIEQLCLGGSRGEHPVRLCRTGNEQLEPAIDNH